MNDVLQTTATPLDPHALREARGAALKSARVLAGLSARKLADRVNDRTRGSDLTTHAIYAYERGKVLLGRDAAERIAEVLKLPVGELLLGDPDYAYAESGLAGVEGVDDAAAERGGGRLRLAQQMLLEQAELLSTSAGVLRRQLARAQPGSTQARDFVAGFNLAADDARQLLDSPAVGWVQRAGRVEGYDTLQELIEAGGKLHEALNRQRIELFEAEGDVRVARRCEESAEALEKLLDAFEGAAGSCRRLFAG